MNLEQRGEPMNSIPSPGNRRPFFLRIRARVFPLLLAGPLFAATGARAQAPTLVKDIYPGSSATATPVVGLGDTLGVSGGKAYLHGGTAQGLGLWVTDDTAADPRFLLDVSPANAPGADVNGTFFYSATSREGSWLCRSDGTVAGTAFLRRFPGDDNHRVHLTRFTKVGSLLFFATDDGVNPPSLWKSDGTETGTTLVKVLPLGAFSSWSVPTEFVDVGGALLFSCNGSPGYGLWRSDGTETGTFQIANLDYPGGLVNVDGTLFFRASDATHGAELWKSDGTAAGTVLLKDLVAGAAGSSPRSLVSFGGALWFTLGSDGSIWKSDGTEGGTALFSPLASGKLLVRSGVRLFFTYAGTQLYATDGTGPGTGLVQGFSAPFDLSTAATIPGALLFWVDRGIDGLELWRTDGTTAGTSLVKTVDPGNEAQFPGSASSVGGAALLQLNNNSVRLLRSDGTAAGTVPVARTTFLPNDGVPNWLVDVNGTLLFAGSDAEHGTELWKSDGTPAGTSLVRDIESGPGSSGSRVFFATPSNVFFFACVSATGCELYRTDGTEAGTRLVKDILPGSGSGYTGMLGVHGDGLLFTADEGVHGSEPWWSDGTTDGTFLLGDLNPGAASSDVRLIGVLNGAHFFSASDGTNTTLWKTDGTAAGTVAVGPVPNAAAGETIGGFLVFPASDPARGEEVWRTDGTSGGTSLLLGINPVAGFSPRSFLRVGSRIVFFADDGVHGYEPWTTDGTPAGTALLKDINLGKPQSIGTGAAVLGDTLFFFADDGVHGFEPWKTDGSSAGTVLVRDIAPGAPGSNLDVDRFVAGGHEVFFTASDHVSGRELWRSDGTAAGTTRVADLVPGLQCGPVPWSMANSMPVLARSGGRVFFTATDGTTGYELWSLSVPLKLHTITPCRVADTRDPDGPTGGAPIGSSETAMVQVTGSCGIPSTALSIAANVTVVSPSAAGSLSVFAGGPIVSGTTQVPVTPGKTRALNAIPILGTAGSLSVRAELPQGGTTHVLLDVSGYFE
jgi:ELWxxDGT repeat protein